MKTNKEIQEKITILKQELSELKQLHERTDIIETNVGFSWYTNNVIAMEKIRHDIKLLEWVLK